MKFSEQDLKQIDKKGLTLEKIESQVEQFKNGIPFIDLESPATIGHGILKFTDAERKAYISAYDAKRNDLSILKFVPASGAATRMFKSLFNFITEFNPDGDESLYTYISKNKNLDLALFLVGLDKLPFYDIVMEVIKKTEPDFESYDAEKQKWVFVKTMLDENLLDYGAFPKGLLPFHKYDDRLATAFEEHMYEAALYASANQKAQLHFTISEGHNDSFNEAYNKIKSRVETATNTDFDISFSFQKESTDTIALTPEKEPFREADGTLLFRPSGHGALIENLNDLDADIVFIKNIDNLVVSKYNDNSVPFKKLIAGVLLEVQEQVFSHLKTLDKADISETELVEIATFVAKKLNEDISLDFEKSTREDQVKTLRGKLNRPIRVCGMVINEGEPGGGPFWVEDANGNLSLQIVETAQIDSNDPTQKQILSGSTHFNPTDLVCGTKDYQGNAFDLLQYVNPNSGFITKKTKEGKELLALELPGLWNGAMADWISVFVEVPVNTFNPVKTVTDLLRPAHQL
ncbi:DUF4301 family protein [Formosa haliotis]|uniref:DUF4301 family protein n=1 Tax=Formosa haliotis TaxID=1555194 RepID=UPI0008241D66|nr:DUF4301 family protein [Formosa haliotis]